ncbi:ZIP family metal transporter [Parvularcula lutaonensis]|uniref:Uncharacterized protein n=1 Tax=Parvularcula lutaonensis TaxID=491923 RepID=A0ABV7MA68_9PROT|nr:hypothetical protein [Parvularcula lutaonensis]GGY44266.1 hypothetical protein GCM10007148_11450 [Parvularcula lutaonensis]
MGEIDASVGVFGWPPALVASVLAATMASVGIFAVSTRPDTAQRYRPYFAALASGILLSTAMFILPEAFGGSQAAPLAALAGYFTLFVFSRFARRPEGRAFAAFFAIAAHSTLDGMEYGLLFAASDVAGFLGAFGLIMHEFAEGVVLFLILRGAGVPKVIALLAALFGAALTTPMGTLATLAVVPDLSLEQFSLALGYAAGALLFVGASQLPEEFGELGFKSSVATYAFGAILAILLMWSSHMHGHSHSEHHSTAPVTLARS